MTKDELRKFARELDRLHAGDARPSLLPKLERLECWKEAGAVSLYLPVKSEPGTCEMFRALWVRGAAVYVPAWNGSGYAPARIREDTKCAEGRMRILEPEEKEWGDPAEIDLWIVPGVLFDRQNTRLGHGKGDIDRYLAQRRSGAKIIGLANPWQTIDAPLPREPHDIVMDDVLSW